MINPIYNAGLSPEKIIARSHARIGVQIKFTMIEEYVNLMFLKIGVIFLWC